MKREEKNQQTKRRIMESALAEFSAKGYGGSSINTICAAEDVSKGIVYHYFENKDELFLACVGECFQRLTEYIRDNLPQEEDATHCLEDYFAIRMRFFYANPVYQRIFAEALLSPPEHLRSEIQKCRQDFDDLNVEILRRLLSDLPLRQGISQEEIIDLFRQFQDYNSVHDQMANLDVHSLETYGQKRRKALDILLYGVIERK